MTLLNTMKNIKISNNQQIHKVNRKIFIIIKITIKDKKTKRRKRH